MQLQEQSPAGTRKAWRMLASFSLVLAAASLFVAVFLFTELGDYARENRNRGDLVTCRLIETKDTQIEGLLMLERLIDRVERRDTPPPTRRAFAETRGELRRERSELRQGIASLKREIRPNGACGHDTRP